MIALSDRTSRQSKAHLHDGFLELLPKIKSLAWRTIRWMPPDHREDAMAEVIAIAYMMYRRLADIGKSEIPLDVLRKQTPLTAEEWEIIRIHPERGVEILERTGEVDEICRVVVLQHHEKCTGRGYPHGLAADEIHYFAKIAAIADVFDALSTDRPYKNALNTFASLRLMQETMREDFDENIFRELIVLMSGQATAMEDAASESEGSDDRRRAA